jgi:DNA-binding beta-propeller fold protein YncE
MKTVLFAVFVLAASPSFAQQSVPDIPFDSVADFLKLPPGMNFGEVPGVAVNAKGHVFVFTRSNSAGGPAFAPAAAQLLEFGPKGEFLREIGKGLYGWSFAHSVRIDKDDNIWAIDKGSDMIIKFNQAGQVMMVFGRRKESADAETKPWENVDPPLPAVDGLFRQPTDVAWDSDGNTYITDGYVNSRVAKYDRNGDWVKSWGDKGTGPGQFRLPHAIAIDRGNNIYVGDRTNRRIQVFDTDGKFLRMFTIDVPPDPRTRAVNGNTPTGERLAAVSGAPNSICITPGPNQVMFVGETTFPGRVFKVSLDGRVLGVIGRSGRQLKQFSGAHALACPSENEVYVAETSNWRVQKLMLRPVTQQTARAVGTSGQAPAARKRTPVVVTRIFTGPDGQTHAEQINVKFAPGETELGEMAKVTGMQIRRQAPNYFQDWHPAGRRQYVVTLSGRGEIELPGGMKIPLDPGHILLAEDVTGKGHISRGVGTEDRVSLLIPLAAP